MVETKPLVLDVDGTFLKTDMLFECFWNALGRAPLRTLAVTVANLNDRPRLKAELAELANLRLDLLPVRAEVQDLMQQSLHSGRTVYFASGSDQSLVDGLARAHGLTHPSLASDGVTNLTGPCKAAALEAAHGRQGFDYVGDSSADIPVWEASENALIVGSVPGAARRLARQNRSTQSLPGGWRKRDFIRALRPHQWVKNVLLLLPLIAAHQFQMATIFLVALGIMAFSAAASAIYIVNDLLDLEADRLHPTKRHRPFASGAVPIQIGMAGSLALLVLATAVGSYLGAAFLLVLLVYVLLSLAYSLKLKRMRWIDIATLAALYTLRVVAGAAAGQVEASGFMLIFIFPVFLALGCVKRLTELTLATTDDRLPGRGYGRTDRGDLLNVAALGTVGALLVFFLYTLSPHAQALYPTQWLLWVAMIPLAIWLVRMVWLGYRGKQDYDPIVFAMKDKNGIGLVLITISLMFYAAGLWQDWLGF